MAKTKKDQRQLQDDEDSNFNRHKKQPKHSSNRKGSGMRVINSYVEEELDYEYDDASDDEYVYTKTR
jgi:hypothetical protein